MSTHWGNEGTVKVGANTVAEIDEWEFTTNASPVDDTAMGDTWETHIAGSGIKSWTGSLNCHWDETDATGQEVLVEGASVTLNLYPEGATTGDVYYTGTASVVQVTVDVKKTGKTIGRAFRFQGNGALTRSVVP